MGNLRAQGRLTGLDSPHRCSVTSPCSRSGSARAADVANEAVLGQTYFAASAVECSARGTALIDSKWSSYRIQLGSADLNGYSNCSPLQVCYSFSRLEQK